jgi:hypothetical protein
VAASVSRATPATDERAEGQRLAARGAFEESVKHWQKTDMRFERERSSSGYCQAEIPLVAAYKATGEASMSYLLFIYVRLRESPPIPPEADFR